MLISYIPIPVFAAEVWTENFNDGNYDGWTVVNGQFSASQGYLEAIEWQDEYAWLCEIGCNSTITAGTWSFDYNPAGGSMYVRFMTEGHRATAGANRMLRIRMSSMGLCSWAPPGDWPPTSSCETEIESESGHWTHIDITVDEELHTQVYVNGSHELSYTFFISDKTFLYFGITTQQGVGWCLDNIVVSDSLDVDCTNETCDLDHYDPTTTEPTTTTPSDTTPGPLEPATVPIEYIALGAGVVVIIVVLVVFMKRK
jgi:hypothetical protein